MDKVLGELRFGEERVLLEKKMLEFRELSQRSRATLTTARFLRGTMF